MVTYRIMADVLGWDYSKKQMCKVVAWDNGKVLV